MFAGEHHAQDILGMEWNAFHTSIRKHTIELISSSYGAIDEGLTKKARNSLTL
jgi:predicted DNA-binding protein (MmcQ/YjbR family)